MTIRTPLHAHGVMSLLCVLICKMGATYRHQSEDCVDDPNSYSGVDWLTDTSPNKYRRRVIKDLEHKRIDLPLLHNQTLPDRFLGLLQGLRLNDSCRTKQYRCKFEVFL